MESEAALQRSSYKKRSENLQENNHAYFQNTFLRTPLKGCFCGILKNKDPTLGQKKNRILKKKTF